MRNDQKSCKSGHVLQSGRFPTALGLFTTDPARHTRLIWCEMTPQPVQGDESKHVIVVNEHRDAAGKASINPYVQCIYCDKEFRGGATRVRGPRALVGVPRIHLMIDRPDTMTFGGLYSHLWLQRVIACLSGPLRATFILRVMCNVLRVAYHV